MIDLAPVIPPFEAMSTGVEMQELWLSHGRQFTEKHTVGNATAVAGARPAVRLGLIVPFLYSVPAPSAPIPAVGPSMSLCLCAPLSSTSPPVGAIWTLSFSPSTLKPIGPSSAAPRPHNRGLLPIRPLRVPGPSIPDPC